MDRERLTKLLALTTSDIDAEALAAIRMANKMLTVEKLTWGEILAAGGTTINISLARTRTPNTAPFSTGESEDWLPPHLTDKVLIDAMFRAIFAQPRSDNEEFWQWVDSVHHYWHENGRLTPRQYQGIRRTYSRIMQHAAG